MQQTHMNERNCLITVFLYITYMSAFGDDTMLVDFSSKCAGSVELSNGTRVCSSSWEKTDADVVCQEKNCGKAEAFGRSPFGMNSGSTWLKGVQCRGGEKSLTKCANTGQVTGSCPEGVAGVVCSGGISKPKVSVTPEVPGETFEDEKQYECCYQWSKELCSPVLFTVTVDLQRPNISVSSPDQQQRPLSSIQVTKGYSFIINCSTSASYPEGLFLLWFSGSNSSVSEPSVNHSASFSFPLSQSQHQGQYSCVYQVTGAGRTYTSPNSTHVVVAVKQPLLPIILPVATVSLLLLVLIGLFFLHRRRRRKRRHVVKLTSPAPAPMTSTNQYEESDDEEEADYVNAPAGKEEDEDEDSDEPDYVNVTEVQNACAVDIYGGRDRIRLTGSGSSRCSGRVEIYYNSQWGTVCDDYWDKSDAQVVCRQVGCGNALSSTDGAKFGPGSGPIWLDDVKCSGSESSLSQCEHRGFGTNNCGHSEDAGVICSVRLPKPSISVTPSHEVTWGQTGATIICSISVQISGQTFTLKHLNRAIQTSDTSTFSLPSVTFDSEGPYYCLCQTDFSGQVLTSPQSDPVTLLVSVVLPVPSLCVSSPDDVPEGLFLCGSLAPTALSVSLQLTTQPPSPSLCPRANTRGMPLALLVGPSVVGVFLLLGLVSLLLFLVLKKRSCGQPSKVIAQTQMKENKNNYVEDSDEDEGDYVNVDEPKHGDTMTVSCSPVQNNPYQSHAHFNAAREESSQVRFVKNSVEESTEEDSENDYENVTDMNAEEEESIYANV
ncbi:hypothetical protein WMY93_002655 [Mugilogobius chulae]|uniref:Deleted in malignant brain tumors 1 protein-like n=1 Tax=Mugilogobius chulae TaxID=88201 RepID=A0AAW0Q5D3_9GOBI